ncbi:MAG: hypothetical protein PF694_09160 [Bacteroidetes bacterium]|jgi:hypothetical protein|nr:hypothetical protein [Bacteroidota bacterium]
MNNTDRTILLPLRKPYFEKYLRFVFKSHRTGIIEVNRHAELGKYLYSRVRYCEPDKVPDYHEQYNVASLKMPAVGTDLSRNHFMYYNADDITRINDFIESISYLDFRLMVHSGVVDLNLNRKTVIEIFSDMVYGDADKYDMLKKDEYRKRRRIQEFILTASKNYAYKPK